MQSLPLYLPCLVFIPSNVYIVKNENTDGICSPNFVVADFSGLFLHPSFLIEYLRSA